MFHSVHEAMITMRQHIAPDISNHPTFLNSVDLLPTWTAAKFLGIRVERQNDVRIAFDNRLFRSLQCGLVHIVEDVSGPTNLNGL